MKNYNITVQKQETVYKIVSILAPSIDDAKDIIYAQLNTLDFTDSYKKTSEIKIIDFDVNTDE